MYVFVYVCIYALVSFIGITSLWTVNTNFYSNHTTETTTKHTKRLKLICHAGHKLHNNVSVSVRTVLLGMYNTYKCMYMRRLRRRMMAVGKSSMLFFFIVNVLLLLLFLLSATIINQYFCGINCEMNFICALYAYIYVESISFSCNFSQTSPCQRPKAFLMGNSKFFLIISNFLGSENSKQSLTSNLIPSCM